MGLLYLFMGFFLLRSYTRDREVLDLMTVSTVMILLRRWQTNKMCVGSIGGMKPVEK